MDDTLAGGEQGDVVVGHVDPVNHARARAEEAALGEERDRCAAMLGTASLELGHLLVGVDVAHEPVGSAYASDAGTSPAASSPESRSR